MIAHTYGPLACRWRSRALAMRAGLAGGGARKKTLIPAALGLSLQVKRRRYQVDNNRALAA